MRIALVVAISGLALLPAHAFVRSKSSPNGTPLRRADPTNIRFFLNDKTAPGLTNSSGGTTITEDSDPVGAVQASLEAWNNVSSANIMFGPLGRTSTASGDVSQPDGEDIITFADTPENRSSVGDAVAITRVFFLPSSGQITSTDVVLNPTLTFSTTLQASTFDIQTTVTHELGHALGASHSGLLSATMFFAVRRASNSQGVLSADDVAFATDVYPKAGGDRSPGGISGTIRLNSGGTVSGALVSAIDVSTGIAVGSITGSDGTYTIPRVPPGRYFVYTEPMDGPVLPGQLGNSGAGANTSFSTEVFGGALAPTAVEVNSGSVSTIDLTVTGGTPLLNITSGGAGPVGGAILTGSGAFDLRSGDTATVVLIGSGLDDPTISEDTISFLGAPIAIQKGSLGRGQVPSSSLPFLRFTVRVAPTAPLGVATAMVRSANAAAVFSAGVRILPPAPVFSAAGVVSGASFLGGSAAPGEIISIFGTGLGPAAGVSAGLDAGTGRLSHTVADVSVFFNGVPAPLFFVSQGQINAQVPFEMEGQSNASVAVRYRSVAGQQVNIPIGKARPGIFVSPGGSQGIVLNQDGTLNGSGNPIARGQVVVIFATGQGSINPSLGTGELARSSPLSTATQTVTATFGNRPGRVQFAGMAPGFVGLLQVNAEVPIDAPVGSSVPVVVNVGGAPSQPNVTVAVR